MTEQIGLVAMNSEGQFSLDKPAGSSKIDILLCRIPTAKEISSSRVLDLETGSDHKYMWHEFGHARGRTRREKPKPFELRQI